MNYRVYNRCKYDIGVRLANGQECSIIPGSFRLMTSDDVFFIESICKERKLFSKKMLVAVDENGKDLTLEDLGGYTDENVTLHLDDETITAMLKSSAKKIEAWLATIEDYAELHGIYEVAKTMDLPASKLKVLSAAMPEKDFIGD